MKNARPYGIATGKPEAKTEKKKKKKKKKQKKCGTVGAERMKRKFRTRMEARFRVELNYTNLQSAA